MESVVKGVVSGGSAAECQKIITFLQGEPQVMICIVMYQLFLFNCIAFVIVFKKIK